MISGTTGNAECVADIAGSLCLGRLLLGLRTLQEASRLLPNNYSYHHHLGIIFSSMVYLDQSYIKLLCEG